MSEAFHIISDGTCNLSLESARQKNITLLPFGVYPDATIPKEEPPEADFLDFYRKLQENSGVIPKTTVPGMQKYMDEFEYYAKEGIPVICFCAGLRLSESIQVAHYVQQITLFVHLDAKIELINSAAVGVQQEMAVLEAVKMRNIGMEFEEAVSRLRRSVSIAQSYFTMEDMEYLYHHQRIGKLTLMAGNKFGFRPVIIIKKGELYSDGLKKDRKAALDRTVDLLLRFLKHWFHQIERYNITVGYGCDYEEAEQYRDRIRAALQQNGYPWVPIPLSRLAPVIAAHTGPAPLGVSIMRKGIE